MDLMKDHCERNYCEELAKKIFEDIGQPHKGRQSEQALDKLELIEYCSKD